MSTVYGGAALPRTMALVVEADSAVAKALAIELGDDTVVNPAWRGARTLSSVREVRTTLTSALQRRVSIGILVVGEVLGNGPHPEESAREEAVRLVRDYETQLAQARVAAQESPAPHTLVVHVGRVVLGPNDPIQALCDITMRMPLTNADFAQIAQAAPKQELAP